MTTQRKSEITIGVLFFVATVSYLIGSELVLSETERESTLARLDSGRLRLGVLLEFVNAFAVMGISILMYPILKRHGENAALGYMISRTIESVLLFVSALGALMLIPLGRLYAANDSTFPGLGTLAIDWHDIAFQIAMITLGLGSLLLCYLLLIRDLVPHWLAWLGIFGYVALFSSALGEVLGQDMSLILFAPGAIFEIIFPFWLIFKGLRQPTPG